MKKMSISEQITYSTVLIRCKYANGAIGSGTGFIINLCQENERFIPALITNSHVVNNSIETEFEFCKADEDGCPIDTEPYSLTYRNMGNTWLHHPDPSVDLCCLLLAGALIYLNNQQIRIFYKPITTALIPSAEQLAELSAMEDVVMVGYPIGLADNYNHKPVIRKGITSSHPYKDYQGKKETLLDIAAFPGSSGSPVFLLNEGSYFQSNGRMVYGSKCFFLGVLYGGPEYNVRGALSFANLPNIPVPVTSIPTNLGCMIKAERILEFEPMLKEMARKEVENNHYSTT